MVALSQSFTTTLSCTCGACAMVRSAFAVDGSFSPALHVRVPDVPIMGIVAITGPSGCGKSLFMAEVERQHPGSLRPRAPRDEEVLHLVHRAPEETLRLLAEIGLGDPRIYLSRYSVLSDGQRERVKLLIALLNNSPIVLADEFLSPLDRVSARIVASGIGRFCRRTGKCLVVASASDDYLDDLRPDTHVRFDSTGLATVEAFVSTGPRLIDLVSILNGSLNDYIELAQYHYGGELAVAGLDCGFTVWRAVLDDELVGVRVLGSPYLREWDALDAIREINECIDVSYRTIVHPRFRGMGVAGRLIREGRSTKRVLWARGAMGLYHPWHASGGMDYLPQGRTLSAKLDRRPSGWQDVGSRHLLEDEQLARLMLEFDHLREISGLGDPTRAQREEVVALFRGGLVRMTDEQLLTDYNPYPCAEAVQYRESIIAKDIDACRGEQRRS